jgi:preprotein translocase subunit SecA
MHLKIWCNIHHYAIVDEVDSVLIDGTSSYLRTCSHKGDRHEFNELKPKIQILVDVQRKCLTGWPWRAKKELLKETKKKADSTFEV